ncbi:MAG: flagellar hook-associated protein FlgK [Bryobacteraceae bacterium]|jgi:flagellar hook-associated protein 1 FlgK
MATISTALYSSAEALQAMEQAMAVTQNNVANANTPGYATQVQTFTAQPFNVEQGFGGGVSAGIVQSTRDVYAEEQVRTQQSAVNFAGQSVSDLSALEPQFDVTGASGISAALNNLFNSFSALSVSPNDTVARQTVLTQAQNTANAFQQTANAIFSTGNSVQSETQATVNDINRLSSTIAQINSQVRVNPDGSVDAGVDAQMYSTLEELSQDVNVTTVQQSNGQIAVLLDGQTPLVMGDTSFAIQGNFSLPQAEIEDQNGNDITSQITGGQLGSEVQTTNTLLPSYLTSLNTLAQTLADQVNTTLAGGLDENGQAPTTGLFSYDTGADAASTLTVNPLTTDQLAAALPGAPGGNGNALALAALQTANVVNGETFTGAFGALGGQVGQDVSGAQTAQQTSQSLLTQAQNLRQQVSGVSLDQEAANLMVYQEAYQATSKMFSILENIENVTLGLIPAAAS